MKGMMSDASSAEDTDFLDGVAEDAVDEKILITTDSSEPRWRTRLNSNTGWIKQLNKKECINFKLKSGGLCFCGRTKDQHIAVDSVDTVDRRHGTWRKQDSLVKQETDTCGRIEYSDDATPSVFMRLDNNTSEEHLRYLFNNFLQLTSNDLYVHFVDFEEHNPLENKEIIEKLTNKLTKGLKVLTEKTRVFLTSQGLKTGSSRYLHTALATFYKDHAPRSIPPVVFACTSWGSVDDKDMFADCLQGVFLNIKPGKRSKKDVIGGNLSPYFTHHFFVDDGTFHVLTKHLQRFNEQVEIILQKIEASPSVVVLMNGGKHAEDHVIKALGRNIPVIIVRGSGGIADEIALAYQNCRTRRRKSLDRDGKVSFRHVPNLDGTCDSAKNNKIKKILQNLELITVFDPEPQTLDLDMVIVWALLKAKQESKLYKLLDSFLANNPDYTWQRSYNIQGDSPQTPLDPHAYFLLEAMYINSAAVVETFLKGLDLNQHFTMDNIIQLYTRYHLLGPCKQFITDAKSNTPDVALTTVSDVRSALQEVLGACYPLTCTGKGCQCDAVSERVHMNRLLKDPSSFRSCLPPIQEMFLWALFTNKQRVAMILWKRCEDKLASALVAEMILRKLSKREKNVDYVTDLRKDAEEFENIAVNMLKICYQLDEDDSHALLLRNNQWWGDKSCLQLAVQFNSKKFISQQPCTLLLNKIWYGGINQYESPITKMVLCALSPIPGLSLPFAGINTTEKNGFSQREKQTNTIPCQKLFLFYTSPVVKYALNLMAFITFLILFSYVLLVDLQQRFTLLQALLCVYVATYLGEEIRQIFAVPERSLSRKISEYFRQFWNKVDVAMILLFAIGMSLAAWSDPTIYYIRHVLLNLDIFLFCMRLLQMFVVKKTLGPMLTMIYKMIGDTVSFMVILLVFVLSYGVVSHSMMFPQANSGWRLLYDVPKQAYWQIYGEFFLDDTLDERGECFQNGTSSPLSHACSSRYIVELLLAAYAIITHVLLLNILIAKFNFTFAKVQGEANKIWAWHRCEIIHEYHYRPWLPPPFNIFYFLYWVALRLAQMLCWRCRCGRACARNRNARTHASKRLLFQDEEKKGVYISEVGCTHVEITWDCEKLGDYRRYRIQYKMRDMNQTASPINLELAATNTCTVRDLCSNSDYEFLVLGGQSQDETGEQWTWQDICTLRKHTKKENFKTKELKRREEDLAKRQPSLSSENDLILQKTDALGHQLSEQLCTLTTTVQQTSAGTLEQLTKDFSQLRRDQITHTDLEMALQDRESQFSERVEVLETEFQEMRDNQKQIISLLENIREKL